MNRAQIHTRGLLRLNLKFLYPTWIVDITSHCKCSTCIKGESFPMKSYNRINVHYSHLLMKIWEHAEIDENQGKKSFFFF